MNIPVMVKQESDLSGQLLRGFVRSYGDRVIAQVAACHHQGRCVEGGKPILMQRHIRQHTTQGPHAAVYIVRQCFLLFSKTIGRRQEDRQSSSTGPASA